MHTFGFIALLHHMQRLSQRKMMESGIPICTSCGEEVGVNEKNREVFVSCHHCKFPLCKVCMDDEIKEGRTSCLRCATPYLHLYGKSITSPHSTDATEYIHKLTLVFLYILENSCMNNSNRNKVINNYKIFI